MCHFTIMATSTSGDQNAAFVLVFDSEYRIRFAFYQLIVTGDKRHEELETMVHPSTHTLLLRL